VFGADDDSNLYDFVRFAFRYGPQVTDDYSLGDPIIFLLCSLV